MNNNDQFNFENLNKEQNQPIDVEAKLDKLEKLFDVSMKRVRQVKEDFNKVKPTAKSLHKVYGGYNFE